MTTPDVGSEGSPAMLLVDAHVHLHRCFACDCFFDAAAANFAQARVELRTEGDVYGALMLTEGAGDDRFEALANGGDATGSWQIAATSEPVSLVASRPGVPPIFVIAGRQIATAERLEVLALGTRALPPDGAPLSDTLAALAAVDALAVVPWGFGKWTGRRGRYLTRLFAEPADCPLYAGDNGGRPRGFLRPKLLAFAEGHGGLVLPGTDPLPFPGEIGKVGRYGFVAELELDRARPFASLRRWLERQQSSPRTYGRLEGLWTFLDRQMRLHSKRFGGKRWTQTAGLGKT